MTDGTRGIDNREPATLARTSHLLWIRGQENLDPEVRKQVDEQLRQQTPLLEKVCQKGGAGFWDDGFDYSSMPEGSLLQYVHGVAKNRQEQHVILAINAAEILARNPKILEEYEAYSDDRQGFGAFLEVSEGQWLDPDEISTNADFTPSNLRTQGNISSNTLIADGSNIQRVPQGKFIGNGRSTEGNAADFFNDHLETTSSESDSIVRGWQIFAVLCLIMLLASIYCIVQLWMAHSEYSAATAQLNSLL